MKNRSIGTPLVNLGAWFWLSCLVLVPLIFVFLLSFMTRKTYGGFEAVWTLSNYLKIFDPSMGILILKVFGRSFLLAFVTTFFCALLAYPFALFLVFKSGRYRHFLFALMIIPFWTNFLIRTYAWFALLSDSGWIMQLLHQLGFELQSLNVLFTWKAVYLGMVYNYLPFMAMTLYINIEKIDVKLIEASHDLGAGVFQTFTRIIFPLSIPGLIAGSVLVFIPCLGEFVIPDILGGSTQVYVGNLLTQQFLTARHWPMGAAISMWLLAAILLLIYLFKKNQKTKWGEAQI